MCSQITAEQNGYVTWLKQRSFSYFVMRETLSPKCSWQEYFKFFKQRSEMLQSSPPVCTVPSFEADSKCQIRELKRQHGAITQTLHSLLHVINHFYIRKRNILCRLGLLNMPRVLIQEKADQKRYWKLGRTVHSFIHSSIHSC